MSYKFFQNKTCEYFPCHEGGDAEGFNCLFCYCPLYALGENCGGNFSYTREGIKDCSRCLYPHALQSYENITSRFEEIAALCKKQDNGCE